MKLKKDYIIQNAHVLMMTKEYMNRSESEWNEEIGNWCQGEPAGETAEFFVKSAEEYAEILADIFADFRDDESPIAFGENAENASDTSFFEYCEMFSEAVKDYVHKYLIEE